MLFFQRIEINKINKAECQFISVLQINCFAEIFKVLCMQSAINIFIVPQKIFPSEYDTAAETEIPGKESIKIKKVHILILVGNKWPGNIFSIFVNICKPFINYFAPVMPYSHRQVHSWCKIVNTRINRSNIGEVNKADDRLAI